MYKFNYCQLLKMITLVLIVLQSTLIYSQEISTEILFGGDFAFAKSYHDEYKRNGRPHILEEKGYEYTIQNLLPFMQHADHVIINLETPITHLKKSEFDGEKDYLHYEDPNVTPELLKKFNVDAVSLANNHTLDFSEEGLQHTIDYLKEQNISLFGAGKNENEAKTPHIKSFKINDSYFKIAVIGAFEFRKGDYDKKYRFYADSNKAGCNKLTIETTSKQIKEIKIEHPDAFVIVYPHWGENYVWKNNEQTKLAHALIDAGADLIIGHGAHKIQEIEYYKDKWIVYSLGNFLFNTWGRFKKLNAEPFSMVGMLKLSSKTSSEYMITLNLYPIFSNNQITNFQPYFLQEKEANEFLKILQEKSTTTQLSLLRDTSMGETKFYIQLPIKTIK